MRLSIILEWANTRLNGVARAWMLLDALAQQWRQIVTRDYPPTLPTAARSWLETLEPQVEVLVGMGNDPAPGIEEAIRARLPVSLFRVQLVVVPGLEYYPLKDHAGRRAHGDVLLFVDSDIVPEDSWLAHLLGSFAQPGVDVVSGQTYVAPVDVYSRAFAVGWTYLPRDPAGRFHQPRKIFANSLAIRSPLFRRIGFPPIGRQTRGATSLMRAELSRLGIPMWENQSACATHPPPSSFRHFAVRAIAQGRDYYLMRSEERRVRGLLYSWRMAGERLGRGVYRTFRYRQRVGLRTWEMPAALTICSSYYACLALGGLLTYMHPRAMMRHFRI